MIATELLALIMAVLLLLLHSDIQLQAILSAGDIDGDGQVTLQVPNTANPPPPTETDKETPTAIQAERHLEVQRHTDEGQIQ